MKVVMKPLVCPGFSLSKVVYVAGTCQLQLEAVFPRQMRAFRWVISCIVADVTIKGANRWYLRLQTGCCSRLCCRGTGLVYVKRIWRLWSSATSVSYKRRRFWTHVIFRGAAPNFSTVWHDRILFISVCYYITWFFLYFEKNICKKVVVS